jgi:hypothetical protein
VDASADPIARFEHDYLEMRSAQLARCGQSGGPSSDDQNISLVFHKQSA